MTTRQASRFCQKDTSLRPRVTLSGATPQRSVILWALFWKRKTAVLLYVQTYGTWCHTRLSQICTPVRARMKMPASRYNDVAAGSRVSLVGHGTLLCLIILNNVAPVQIVGLTIGIGKNWNQIILSHTALKKQYKNFGLLGPTPTLIRVKAR